MMTLVCERLENNNDFKSLREVAKKRKRLSIAVGSIHH